MSKEKPGCQHSAGALENGKLSESTYNKIVQNIIDSGEKGFAVVHPELPCAESLGINAAPGLVPKDLHDKQKYPDFHNNVMGDFEKIALALDLEGQFSLPYPLWDPFAIGLKLGLDVSFELPDLPTITPVDLALALNIKIPDLPDLVVSLGIPSPPSLNFSLPSLDLNLLLDLSLFMGWPLKLPEFILGLAFPPDIGFVMDMLKVPPDPCPVIKKMLENQMFGPAKTTDLTKAIVIAEKASFASKAATIAVVSLIVGDGGENGFTGTAGKNYGFRDAVPVKGKDFDSKARNVVIEAFKIEFGREPYLKEAQFIQLIGRMENGYGTAWPKDRKYWPPQATSSNNWGNIHGSGDAGSFQYIDYNNGGQPYGTSYAMYSSPVAGCRALIRHLLKVRPYIHQAILEDKSLYKPIFLMSSTAVFGKNKKPPAGPDAVIPEGKTYYEADPGYYLNNARIGLKVIMKNLNEKTDFDIMATSNVPYEEPVEGENIGSGNVASSDQENANQ